MDNVIGAAGMFPASGKNPKTIIAADIKQGRFVLNEAFYFGHKNSEYENKFDDSNRCKVHLKKN